MQNFNDIISYIEFKLGIKSNFIEYDRNEIINFICEHTLPAFSQKSPKTVLILIGPKNLVNDSISSNLYRIPNAQELHITEISDIYYTKTDVGLYEINGITLSQYTGRPVDAVIYNTYSSVLSSLSIVRSFDFIKPDLIKLTYKLTTDLIVKLNVEHGDLSTIPSDIYHSIFKPQCLYDIIDGLILIRDKYTELTTPFGSISLNVQRLETIKAELQQTLQDKYEWLPPKTIIEFF